MSLPCFTWVLDHSEERLGNRLVLLALAEHAHDDGSKAYPAISTLMKRTRLSERQVRNCLRALEGNGSITCTGELKNGTRVYAVGMSKTAPANVAAPAKTDARIAPKPSSTRPKDSPTTKAREPKTVNRVSVTDAEHDLCDGILAAFNDVFECSYSSTDYRKAIIGRVRERPTMTVAEHRALIEKMSRHPWWKDAPTPAVIYGNGRAFDRALNQRDEAEQQLFEEYGA